jgi:uncharacterized protein YbbC (DUF1343 family)
MNASGKSLPATRLPQSGLDRLLADDETIRRLSHRQVGFLTNHASVAASGIPASRALMRTLADAGGAPIRLYTPEHGMQLSAGAGEPVHHGLDPLTGLPVHSLYGGGGLEDSTSFDDIDTLVIDLRDIGVRCYTYAATAAQAARRALEQHIEVIICDRANPLGPGAEGPRPEPSHRSFLAFFDVPFVHGHTLAELLSRHVAPAIGEASYLVYPADISLRADLGWTPPSPALSHPDAVAAYAGLVLLEATNISEGRSSSLSFRSVSAPGLKAEALAEAIVASKTGFRAVPGPVTHMRGDYAGVALPGVTIWPVTEQHSSPLSLGIHLLAWLREHHPDFIWLPRQDGSPGSAIDILFGRMDLREKLNQGQSAGEIIAGWR